MAELISVSDLRGNFPWVVEQLNRGKEFLLLLRSKPIAKITPFSRVKKEDSVSITRLFASPQKEMLLETKKNAVKIIREERERFHEK